MITGIGSVAVMLCFLGGATSAMASGSIESDPIDSQALQAQQPNYERTIGICHPVENKEESKLSAVNGLDPLTSVYGYLKNIEHQVIGDADFFAAKVTLLQAPSHGELKLYKSTEGGWYFSSNYSYEGSDSATVLVEIGGYKVKVIYHFVLMPHVPGSTDEGTATDDKSICPNGYIWKISSTVDPSGNSTISSIEYLPADLGTGDTLTSSSLNDWLSLAQLDGKIADLSGINVTVADLPNGAVGQAVGNTITLDDNAACKIDGVRLD